MSMTTERSTGTGRVCALGALLLAAAVALLPAARAADAAHPAENVVREAAERVLARLEAEKNVIESNPGRVYDLAQSIILPHFDFERMSRWVLGRHWRDASEAQRERFTEEFRTLLVRTYARALAEYSEQEVEFLATRERSEDDVQVRTEVRQSGGPPIPIHYSMHRTDGSWKVYDVTVEGISYVRNFRTELNAEIASKGLETVIRRLEREAGLREGEDGEGGEDDEADAADAEG